MNNTLIDKVQAHVKELFREKHDNRSAYHTFDHTREVAVAAQKIGRVSNLNDEDLEAVVIAAWFHDTGYLFRKDDHESSSAETAEAFLRKEQVEAATIQRIRSCILATQVYHVPVNPMEEVIHDADYINLAGDDNLHQAELLKKETVNYGGREPTEEEWLTSEMKFLLHHRYYSPFGRKQLDEKKDSNIKKIQEKLNRLRASEIPQHKHD